MFLLGVWSCVCKSWKHRHQSGHGGHRHNKAGKQDFMNSIKLFSDTSVKPGELLPRMSGNDWILLHTMFLEISMEGLQSPGKNTLHYREDSWFPGYCSRSSLFNYFLAILIDRDRKREKKERCVYNQQPGSTCGLCSYVVCTINTMPLGCLRKWFIREWQTVSAAVSLS